MKKFETGDKINFVDENNVFVGYDLGQSCCENADWFISYKEETVVYDEKYNEIYHPDYDIERYNFDKEYFVEIDCPQLDCGGMVRFKLVSNEGLPLYLHIYNSHNGYYGHGFKFGIGETVIQEDYL